MLGGGKTPPAFLFVFYSASSGGMRRHTHWAEPPHVPVKLLNNTWPKPDLCFLNPKWLTEPPDVFNLRGRCKRVFMPLRTFSDVLHDNSAKHGPWQLWSISRTGFTVTRQNHVKQRLDTHSLYAPWGEALVLNVCRHFACFIRRKLFWAADISVRFSAASWCTCICSFTQV